MDAARARFRPGGFRRYTDSARNDIVRQRNDAIGRRVSGIGWDFYRPFACWQHDAPNVFAGFYAVHADLSGPGAAGISHPHYPEAGFLVAALYADDVAFLAGVFQAGDACSGSGYIDGSGLARERPPSAIHSPNTYRERGRHPVVYAASHESFVQR